MRSSTFGVLLVFLTVTNLSAHSRAEEAVNLGMYCYLPAADDDANSKYQVVLKGRQKLEVNQPIFLNFNPSLKPYLTGVDIAYLGKIKMESTNNGLSFKYIFSFALKGMEAFTLDENGQEVPLVTKVPSTEHGTPDYPIIGVRLGSHNLRFINCNLTVEPL